MPPATMPSEFLALQNAVAGRFALDRELGRGGMGIVYLARDLALDRPVAIKLLPSVLAGHPSLRERFLREARTAARLSHPNIVPIHQVEAQGDLAWFVMAYIDGETLAERVQRQGPLAPEEALRILQEMAWALAYAHRNGVIHRDVKPGNILLERGSGRSLLSDFGIALVEAITPARGSEVIGTVRYMSPEQVAGATIDGRSDLFALGAVATFALTGRTPSEGGAAGLSAPRLAPIVLRCLALDPAERFPDGESLADALDAARGRAIVVAPPVREFVELYKTLAVEIAGYAAVVVVLAAELLLVSSLWIQAAILGGVLAWAFFGTVGLGILRFVQLVRAARRLQNQGYGLANVRSALEQPAAAATGRRWSGLGKAAALLGGLAGAVLWGLAFRWQITFSLGWVLDGIIMAAFTLAPVVAVRAGISRMLRPGRQGWWSRFWWKTLEWKVFRLARSKRVEAAPQDPTEVALGEGARELFALLPDDLRAKFADVPGVLQRIQAQAGRLRARTGPDGDGRLGSSLAALEQVRLDLLRLRADQAGDRDLTDDLDAARRVAEDIERFLEAKREV